jgi:hypothetical protein
MPVLESDRNPPREGIALVVPLVFLEPLGDLREDVQHRARAFAGRPVPPTYLLDDLGGHGSPSPNVDQEGLDVLRASGSSHRRQQDRDLFPTLRHVHPAANGEGFGRRLSH